MTVAPPRPKGPHLNAMRAFESAARHSSFTAAAEELCVSPGAIAQHIKSLEAWAESALFIRNAQGVALTPLGNELLPEFIAAFDQIGNAVQALRTKATPKKIRIVTIPAIAQLWLSAKLGEFRSVAPDISVSVVAVETMPNLLREPFDIALFFDEGSLDENTHEVFRDRIFPVCDRKIADRLKNISDLKYEILLQDSTWSDDWAHWLNTVAKDVKLTPQGPVYSLFAVALEEAQYGAGVLMAHEARVSAALKIGTLVAPFDQKAILKRRLVMKTTPHFATKESCKLLKSILCSDQ